MRTFTCVDCGETKPVTPGSTTGYGVSKTGHYVCFACCGKQDAATMAEDGRITLYYDGKKVSNWPGTLAFTPTHVRHGRHNIVGTMQTVYFAGPDGAPWFGQIYGENTQILHCRRMKGGPR